MAIRNIRVDGDDILRMKCKPVKEITPRVTELIDDMFDTMYEASGVGLAAPQRWHVLPMWSAKPLTER